MFTNEITDFGRAALGILKNLKNWVESNQLWLFLNLVALEWQYTHRFLGH